MFSKCVAFTKFLPKECVNFRNFDTALQLMTLILQLFQITILNLLMDMDTVTDTAIKDMVMDTDIAMVMADTEVMDGKSFKLFFNK